MTPLRTGGLGSAGKLASSARPWHRGAQSGAAGTSVAAHGLCCSLSIPLIILIVSIITETRALRPPLCAAGFLHSPRLRPQGLTTMFHWTCIPFNSSHLPRRRIGPERTLSFTTSARLIRKIGPSRCGSTFFSAGAVLVRVHLILCIVSVVCEVPASPSC